MTKVTYRNVLTALSVLSATSLLGACSTTSSVKTSASNPAPITYKVASAGTAGQQYASLGSVTSRSGTVQSYSAPAPTYQPSMPDPAPVRPRATSSLDTANVDTKLYTHQKVGRPYKIKGKQYTPEHNPSYDETGIASWYGPNFHGKLTANGETYDKNGLTAAHKTLPLNSNVHVTNLETGKSITLRLNDRGPFVDGRIIDLSAGAAKILGVSGLAKVRVQYAGPADPQGRAQAQIVTPSLPRPDMKPAPQIVATPKPLAPVVVPQTAELTPHAPNSYTPLSVVPRGVSLMPTPKTVPAPIYVAPNKPYQPTQEAKPRPRQVFTPPTNGGVMTMTITGPIHMASANSQSGYAAPVNTAPIDAGGMFIQAATFSTQDRAQSVESALSNAGPVTISNINRNGRTLHRVLVGPYDSEVSASNAMSIVNGLGYSDAKIVSLN